MTMPVATPMAKLMPNSVPQNSVAFRQTCAPGHDIDALHDRHQEGEAERQRHEDEMVHRGRGELQPRELDDERIDHVAGPFGCPALCRIATTGLGGSRPRTLIQVKAGRAARTGDSRAMTSSSIATDPKAAGSHRKWLDPACAERRGRQLVLRSVLPLLAGGLLLPQAWRAGACPAPRHCRTCGAAGPARSSRVDRGLLVSAHRARSLRRARCGACERTDQAEASRQPHAARSWPPPSWTAARSSGRSPMLVVEQVDAIDGYLTRYLPAMAQAAMLPLGFRGACCFRSTGWWRCCS